MMPPVGNYEFDLRPDGLGKSIGMAADGGPCAGAVKFADPVETAKEEVSHESQ